MVGSVGVATGIGGVGGPKGPVGVVWFWAIESVSSKTLTKLLMVRRTLLKSRLLVGREDTSFKVDPRRWRELEVMENL